MKPAIIVFAHGSRDPLWRQPIEAVASEISRRDSATRVCCAYLELCPPTLTQAASDLIASGADEIKVFPLFLGVGKHAREDLPLLMAQIRTAHPQIRFCLLPAAGESPAFTALMAELALSGTA